MPHAINAAVSVISVIKQFRNLEYLFRSFFDALVTVVAGGNSVANALNKYIDSLSI